MKLRRRLRIGITLLVLTALLGFLFVRTQAVDIEAQDRVMLDLRELGKLDAEWNVNILRSHIGLNLDYDPLAAPLPRMRALRAQLDAALYLTRGESARRALQVLGDRLQEKEAMVEQFKSQNAVLRNALVYFPPAVSDLKLALYRNDERAPARAVVALNAALNELLVEILRFNLAPDIALGAHIRQNIDSIMVQRSAFAPSIGEFIEELAGHARAIVRFRQMENQLEAHINATSTDEALDQLRAQFDKAFDDVLLERQRYRSYLFAYSGLLLVLLSYSAWRLRRSYRIIGLVNQRLQGANDSLEMRVAERTAELEAQSRRLEQLAQHDSLTGLINYGMFMRMLDHALVRASRRGSVVVVMFIDLDGFKAVNDTWGHATGDLVLKEVARRVQRRLRKEDALARLGGDEFVILVEEANSREGALRVAQNALDEIAGIVEADGHPVTLSASIGISSACGRTGATRGGAAVLAEADLAMYQAKQAGKNAYAVSARAQWVDAALEARHQD